MDTSTDSDLQDVAGSSNKFSASQIILSIGPNAKVWHAAFKYNHGSTTGRNPIELRRAGHKGAIYADGVFRYMGITPPDTNNQ